MFSGRGGEYDAGWVLEAISPYTWACLGIACAMFLSVLGAAWLVDWACTLYLSSPLFLHTIIACLLFNIIKFHGEI